MNEHHDRQPPRTLIDLLRARAGDDPERLLYRFLIDGEEEGPGLGGGELDAAARAIAVRLVECGAGGRRALLLYPPGLDFVAAFFGCLYAAVVAVPAYPPSRRTLPRLRSIAESAEPAVVLTTGAKRPGFESLASRAPELAGARWLSTDEIPGERAADWRPPAVDGDTLAFLQYTSGSTADPKGVEITHRHLLHNERMIRRAFGLSPESIVVGWLPLYHDMGLIGNLLQPLYCGGTAVLMSPMAFLRRPRRWLAAISRYRATTSGGPDFAYELCVRKIPAGERRGLDLGSWRVAFNGSEPVRAATLQRFAEAFAPCGFRPAAFYPCYGLAEATLFVSGGDRETVPTVRAFEARALAEDRVRPAGVRPAAGGDGDEPEARLPRTLVSSGRPWLEQEVRIVDPRSRIPSAGDRVGEIWVRGPSVAGGYRGDPETSERDFKARLADGTGPYLRTGDLGFVDRGELFVTGRRKDLIILRGRNHYPQDLERTAVDSHPALGPDAAAFSFEEGEEERLVVAAEVARRAMAEVEADLEAVAEAVRRCVAREHEARVHEVVLLRPGTVPKTSSGKIRRRACRAAYLEGRLAAVGRSRLAAAPAPPAADRLTAGDLEILEPADRLPLLEAFLRRRVAALLEVAEDRVEPRRPLTALGLDSLSAAELGALLESELGAAPPAADLLAGTTLAALAEELLDGLETPPREPIPALGETVGDHPLTCGQEAQWFLHRLAPESAAYSIAAAGRLLGDLDPEALRRALERVVGRHPALSTSFPEVDGEPVQRVHGDPAASFEWTFEDAAGWDAERLRERLSAAAGRPFDLGRRPLLRLLLLARGGAEHLLLLTVHHAVADFWSLALVVDELGRAYAAEQAGGPLAAAPPQLRYSDFARWQRQMLAGDAGRRLEDYWRRRLAAAPAVVHLPWDRPRPPVQTYRGAARGRLLTPALGDRLRALARERGATLYMALLAVFTTWLHRVSGDDRLVVGSPSSGRGRPQLEGVVGYFVNPLPLAADLGGDPRWSDHLARTRRTVLDALRHQDLPFDRLVELLEPRRDPSRSPIFQVLFTLQQTPPRLAASGLETFALGQAGGRLELGGLQWESVELEQQSAELDLTLMVAAGADGLRLTARYNRDLFDAVTAERLLDHLARLLAAVGDDPERRLSELPLLHPAERHQLVVEWNATGAELAPEATLAELVERWARRTPEAVAVGRGDRWLTYGELDRRAGELAARLGALGVGPEVLVAICAAPGPEMVIGLLAVLASGGAYLPLDPTYPRERLAFMLQDAGPRVLLAGDGARRRLDGLTPADTRVLDLGPGTGAREAGTARQEPITVPGQPRSSSPAYVIYTSGSTGHPKGVVIPHRAAVNFLASMGRQPGLGQGDTLLAVTTLAFDISVLEIFLPLAAGARLVQVGRETAADGRALGRRLERSRATVMQGTPATWRLLAESGWQGRPGLKMLCGGEALPRELAARLVDRGCGLWNLYGPTETTVWSAVDEVAAAAGPVSLGRPIANTRIHLLDRRLEPVPAGVAGEVYIAGDGLARGYLGQPRLTAERFVPDPLADGAPGERLYRVGDLARRRGDGTIFFLGRVDHQVKVRGFRIELGEIEAALARHQAVAENVVTVHEAGPGDQRLVAAAVPRGAAPPAAELRAFLGRSLPEHMVPGDFVWLEALPHTANGKVDRAAAGRAAGERLAAPATDAGKTAPTAPELAAGGTGGRIDSVAEAAIARLWGEVLGREPAARDENFFDVGGHSLLLARLHSRLVEHFERPDLTLVDLFRHPTVAAQARLLGVGEAAPAPAAARRRRPAAGTEVAIIGMAGRFPAAPDLEAFWRQLRGGVEAITFFAAGELAATVDPRTLADPGYVKARGVLAAADEFDAPFFGFSRREAEVMDPQHRLFLEGAWEALEDAGYNPRQVPGEVGVFAAAGINTYLLEAGRDTLEAAAGSYQAFIGNDKDFVPTRVSYKLGLRGPSVNVQTACSSSLVAVHLACQSLASGESTMALAGGVAVRFPQRAGYLHRSGGILSADGHCRAFDAAATGTVPGNGLGIVVLKPLAAALADGDRVRAVIKGTAVNNDGSLKIGYTAPSADGQAEVIRRALDEAGIAADSIGYVEAHGTGTELGDPIEIAALTEAFGGVRPTGGLPTGVRPTGVAAGRCALGSVKTNVGHLDTAAGIAGLIKTVLALEHREIPPSLHFEAPNPRIDFAAGPFYVNREPAAWEAEGPRRAGVSSFGIGGTNVHAVLEEAPPQPPAEASRRWQLLLLSARSEAALERATAALGERLGDSELELADVAYTLQVGRPAFGRRRMLLAESRAAAAAALAEHAGGDRPPERLQSAAVEPGAAPEVVFLFPGQGAQHPGMGRELYDREPVFRRHLDRSATLLEPELGVDLRSLLFPAGDPAAGDEAARRLRQTRFAQPALFAVEVALARLWMSWGIVPAAMIGHSVGELVAACLAGVLELPDALRLVAERGRLMQALPTGAMLAVARPAAEVEPALAAGVGIAALNSPSSCVLSGPEAAVAAVSERLRSRGIPSRRLHTSHAFHSSMMEPAVEPFIAAVARCRLAPPKIPFASNLSGAAITDAEATDPAAWGRRLVAPVRFAAGVAAFADAGRVFLEVGPGHNLSTLGRQQAGESTFISSLPHPRGPAPRDRRGEEEAVLTALGRLWLAGVEVDWQGFHRPRRRRRVPLPTYPFERQRYWLEPTVPRPLRPAPALFDKERHLADWFYAPVWKQSLLAPLPPPAAPAEEAPRQWLVLADDTSLGRGLAERLRSPGRRVITAAPGSGAHRLAEDAYRVAPGSREDLRALLAEIGTVHHVVHAWTLGAAAGGPRVAGPLERLEEVQERGFDSLLALFGALSGNGRQPPELSVVTSDLHRIGGETCLYPEKALLPGLLRVAALEIPNLACRAVDVSLPAAGGDGGEEEGILDDLVRELLAPVAAAAGTPAEVAWRDGRRWVRHFEALRLPPPDEPVLARGAVVLITGGLGGIGLELATELVERVAARLVLVDNRRLPPREDWQRWRHEYGADDPVSRRIAAVEALEAAGGEVMGACADVTDPAAMGAVVDRARRRFGAITGVIHAAGIAGGGILLGRSPEEAAAVLAPKVRGTLVLEQVLADQPLAGEPLAGEPLDFFLLCSSLTAVSGGFGQGDYCAANAFLDAFAESRARRRGPRVVALGWERWQGIGMSAGIAAADHPLLGGPIVDTPERQVFRSELSADAHWVLSEHRIVGHPTMPGTGCLEMVREALAERAAGGVLELHQTVFLEPLVVGADHSREVLTVLEHGGGEGESRFRIVSRPSGRSDVPWQLHARGRTRIAAAAAAGSPVDLESVRRRCAERTLDGAELRRQGSDFLIAGGRWQTLRSVRFGDGEMLAEIALAPELAADLPQLALHPALLDVAAGFVRLGRDGDYMPLAYDRLRLLGPLSARLWSHAVLHGGGDGGGDGEVLSADLTLVDEAGRPRVEIRGFSMRRVRPEVARELAARGAEPPPPAEPATGTPAAGVPLATLLADGIEPAAGREVLWRALGNPVPPHLVVSPRHLPAVVAGYRAFDPARLVAELASLDEAPEPAGPPLAGAGEASAEELETVIAETWKRFLGAERVAVDDNFFDLGGTSLLGVEVVAELGRRLGREVPTVAVFEAPTVRALAAWLRPADEAAPAFAGTRDRAEKKKAALAARGRGRRPGVTP